MKRAALVDEFEVSMVILGYAVVGHLSNHVVIVLERARLVDHGLDLVGDRITYAICSISGLFCTDASSPVSCFSVVESTLIDSIYLYGVVKSYG